MSGRGCPCKAAPAAALAAVAAIAGMSGVDGGGRARYRPKDNIAISANVEGTGGSNDLYAPDVYVINHTGRDVRMRLRYAPAGAYDIRPAWQDGLWAVVSHPGSALTVDGRTAGFLHYDLHTATSWQTAAGWVVPRSAFSTWASVTLAGYGYGRDAINGFVHTWQAIGSGPGSVAIYPQVGAVVQRAEPVAVDGATVTGRRVWFLIGPPPSRALDAPVVSDPDPARLRGVDVQEWGVVFGPGEPVVPEAP